MAFEAYPSYHSYRLRHGQFNSKDSAGCLLLFFPCILMNSSKKAKAIPG